MFISKMALFPILIIALLIDGYMAYWVVSKYVKFENPRKYGALIKVMIGMVVFFALAFTTFAIVLNNVRLER